MEATKENYVQFLMEFADLQAERDVKLNDLAAKVDEIHQFVTELKQMGIAAAQKGGMSGHMARQFVPPQHLQGG